MGGSFSKEAIAGPMRRIGLPVANSNVAPRPSGSSSKSSAASTAEIVGPKKAVTLRVQRAHGADTHGSSSSYSVTASVYDAVDAPTREKLAVRLRAVAPSAVHADQPEVAGSTTTAGGAVHSALAAIDHAVDALQNSGSWRRVHSSRSPAASCGPGGSLTWPAGGPGQRLELGPTSVVLLELVDVALAATSAGKGGRIGCALILPEWYPSLRALPSSGHGSHGWSVASLFTAPSPGWYTLVGKPQGQGQGTVAGGLLLKIETDDAGTVAAGSAAHVEGPGSSAAQPAKPQAVAAAPSISAHLCVLQHHHTVYCDRKRQVCTAEGSIREGNVVYAAWPLAGLPPPVKGGPWMPPLTRPGAEAVWYVESGEPAGEGDPVLQAGQPAPWPAPDSYCTAGPDGQVLLMRRLPGRTREDMFRPPPVPGLSLPQDDATNPGAVVASVLSTLGAAGATAAESPLYSGHAALRLQRAEAYSALDHPLAYPLTLAEVGRRMAAIVHGPGKGAQATVVVGPVEAAPPRVREVWVEGEARPGRMLSARLVYYGGTPGECEFSWIRVDAEGLRTESPARPFDPLAAYPPPGSAAALADPRCLHITAEDVGCSFKVTCEPVRNDGERGAPTTSKPTKDVETA